MSRKLKGCLFLLKQHTGAAFTVEPDAFLDCFAADTVIISQTVDAHKLGGTAVYHLLIDRDLIRLKVFLAAFYAVAHSFTSFAL